MRTRRRFSVGVAVAAGCLLIHLPTPAQAKDKPDPKVATIEFQDVPDQPHLPGQPLVMFDVRCVIELNGFPQKFRFAKIATSAGSTAPSLATFFNDNVFVELKGLQYELSADKRRITVTGWKDPKTGKFYPVKRVTFSSQARPKRVMIMPKAGIPKVTNPKLPAA